MKKLLILSICLLILIITIPISVGLSSKSRITDVSKPTEATTSPTQSDKINTEDTDFIICEAMQYINEDDSQEVKYAVLAICYNNYMYFTQNGKQLPEQNISKYSDKLLQELQSLLNKAKITIEYNSQRVFIPLAEISPGYTVCSKDYPYILKVASPWDTFETDYNATQTNYNCGISVSGIRYLVTNGSSFIEALMWYLPNFEIG